MRRGLVRKSALMLVGMAVLAAAADAADYESPKKLPFQEALPDVAEKGDLYEFSPDVLNDGIMNSYRLYTQKGWFEIRGNELARVRVHEANVVHQLDQVKKSDMYGKSMKAAAESTYESMKTLITQPVTTLSGVPSGTKRFFGNIYRRTKTERVSDYEDEGIKAATGFAKVKRQIAVSYRCDPYSSNERLQAELDEVAWAAYAGGMSLNVFRMFVVPPVVNLPVSLSESAVELGQMLQDESPQSLQVIVREKLEEINVPENVIEAFLTNRAYSPSRRLMLAAAIYQMREVRNIQNYLAYAIDATNEEEAFFMQRSAGLLLACHKKASPLAALHMAAALPAAETQAGGLLAAFAIDHLLWTKRADGVSSAIRNDLPARLKDAPLHLWVSGSASDRAKAEFEAKKIIIEEDGHGRLLLEEKAG